MSATVDITGIDKGVLLAELFNNAGIAGLGFLQAGRGPEQMSHDQGREIVARALADDSEADHARMFGQSVLGRRPLYFDYLYGRPLKTDLGNDQVDPWGYDRDHGQGALQKLVDGLRASKDGGS
jgi:hypothetical protein